MRAHERAIPRHRGHPRRRHQRRGRSGRPARARAGRRPPWLRLPLDRVRLGLRALPRDGGDDARGRARPAARARGGLPGGGRHARRAGPRVAVGTAHPHPPRVRAVRQPAADPAVRGGAQPARAPAGDRPRRGARERRGRVLGDRGPALRGAGGRARRAAGGLHPARHRARRPLRLRVGDRAARPPRLGDKVEWDHPHDAVLGRRRRRDRGGAPGRRGRARPHRRAVRAGDPRARVARRGRRLESLRRHPERPDRRRRGEHRDRARREPEPRTRPPVDVRAGARVGARHRRAGDRQPGRAGVDRCADARPPRPRRRRRRPEPGDRDRPRRPREPHAGPRRPREHRAGHGGAGGGALMLMRFLARWAANAVALYVAAWLLTGITYGDSGWTLIVAAAVFTLVNMWLRPVVRLLSLPLIILTLGLFLFVVNVLMLYVTDWIVPDFEIETLGAGILGAIIVSVVNWALHVVIPGPR